MRRFAPGSTRQHRVQAWGGMVDVFMLDERQHRDVSLPEDPTGLLGTHSNDRPGGLRPEPHDAGRRPADLAAVGPDLVDAPAGRSSAAS